MEGKLDVADQLELHGLVCSQYEMMDRREDPEWSTKVLALYAEDAVLTLTNFNMTLNGRDKIGAAFDPAVTELVIHTVSNFRARPEGEGGAVSNELITGTRHGETRFQQFVQRKWAKKDGKWLIVKQTVDTVYTAK